MPSRCSNIRSSRASNRPSIVKALGDDQARSAAARRDRQEPQGGIRTRRQGRLRRGAGFLKSPHARNLGASRVKAATLRKGRSRPFPAYGNHRMLRGGALLASVAGPRASPRPHRSVSLGTRRRLGASRPQCAARRNPDHLLGDGGRRPAHRQHGHHSRLAHRLLRLSRAAHPRLGAGAAARRADLSRRLRLCRVLHLHRPASDLDPPSLRLQLGARLLVPRRPLAMGRRHDSVLRPVPLCLSHHPRRLSDAGPQCHRRGAHAGCFACARLLSGAAADDAARHHHRRDAGADGDPERRRRRRISGRQDAHLNGLYDLAQPGQPFGRGADRLRHAGGGARHHPGRALGETKAAFQSWAQHCHDPARGAYPPGRPGRRCRRRPPASCRSSRASACPSMCWAPMR